MKRVPKTPVGEPNGLPIKGGRTHFTGVTGHVIVPLFLLLAACGFGVTSENGAAATSAVPPANSTTPTQYTFQFFDPVGSQRTIANGINDVGVVTGEYLDASWFPGCGCGRHGFVRTPDGALTTFDPPGGGKFTRALGINDLGVIVGYFGNGTGHPHGFVRLRNGSFAQLDYPSPPSVDNGLSDISNTGAILGVYDTGDVNTSINYVFHHDQYTVLPDAPGSAPLLTSAIGINDLGWITGYFQDLAGNFHGFLLRNGGFSVIDDTEPTNVNTLLYKTNDLGMAVGVSDLRSFILDTRKNALSTFSCPGGFYGEPHAINNRGQIVGFCSTEANGPFRGFIATPVRSGDE
jgi:uncharacterized membrane protein